MSVIYAQRQAAIECGQGAAGRKLHKQAQKLMHKLNKLKSIVGPSCNYSVAITVNLSSEAVWTEGPALTRVRPSARGQCELCENDRCTRRSISRLDDSVLSLSLCLFLSSLLLWIVSDLGTSLFTRVRHSRLAEMSIANHLICLAIFASSAEL